MNRHKRVPATVTFTLVKEKRPCTACGGMGEVWEVVGEGDLAEDRMVPCSFCGGNGAIDTIQRILIPGVTTRESE